MNMDAGVTSLSRAIYVLGMTINSSMVVHSMTARFALSSVWQRLCQVEGRPAGKSLKTVC